VNEKLLAAGLAWHTPAYNTNPRLKQLEITACKNKAGLWKTSNPIPPWEFRKKKKGVQIEKTPCAGFQDGISAKISRLKPGW